MTKPSGIFLSLLFSTGMLLCAGARATPSGDLSDAAGARREASTLAPPSLAPAARHDSPALPGEVSSLPWIASGVLGIALFSAVGWASAERRRARFFVDELARTRVYHAALARFGCRLPDDK